MLWQNSLFAFPVPVRMLFYICKETSKATKIDRESPSRLRRRKLKTEVSFWKRFTVSVHSTPPSEKFKNTTITGHFGFVVEENSGREISSLPCSRFIGECCVTSQKTAAKETRKYHDYHNVIVLKSSVFKMFYGTLTGISVPSAGRTFKKNFRSSGVVCGRGVLSCNS